jgi:hypothetical protein
VALIERHTGDDSPGSGTDPVATGAECTFVTVVAACPVINEVTKIIAAGRPEETDRSGAGGGRDGTARRTVGYRRMGTVATVAGSGITDIAGHATRGIGIIGNGDAVVPHAGVAGTDRGGRGLAFAVLRAAVGERRMGAGATVARGGVAGIFGRAAEGIGIVGNGDAGIARDACVQQSGSREWVQKPPLQAAISQAFSAVQPEALALSFRAEQV